jgi:predicted metalloprotease
MLKIDVHPIYVNPKIYRQENYLELKEKCGQTEGLGIHEII